MHWLVAKFLAERRRNRNLAFLARTGTGDVLAYKLFKGLGGWVVCMTVSPVTGLCVRKATFRYRRRVTITELSGNDLTDYQVRIDLDSTNFDFSHFLNGGEDLAFTDAEGNPLPYWVEKMDIAAEEATIWVKVPSIPANSSVDIFMYYGSSEVESASTKTAMVAAETFEDKPTLLGKLVWPGYTCVNPIILQGRRFLVRSKGWAGSAAEADVVEVDKDWQTILNSWPSPNDLPDTYAKVYSQHHPNKIFVFGKGFWTWFDISSESWGDYFSLTGYQHAGVFCPDDGYYYLEVHTEGGTDFMYKSTPEDLLNPSNWTKVYLPAPTYEMYSLAYFKSYIFVLRYEQKTYEWELLKYNPLSDEWVSIMSNEDTTSTDTSHFQYLRTNGERLVATLRYYTPTKHWEIWYTDDGEDWIHAFDVPMMREAAELQCYAFPYGDYIIVLQTNWTFDGYIRVYDLSGNVKFVMPACSHIGPLTDFIKDEEQGLLLLDAEANSGDRDMKILSENLIGIYSSVINNAELASPGIVGDYCLHIKTGRTDYRYDAYLAPKVERNVYAEVLLRPNYDDDTPGFGVRCGNYYRHAHYSYAIPVGYYIQLPRSGDQYLRFRRYDPDARVEIDSVGMTPDGSAVWKIVFVAFEDNITAKVFKNGELIYEKTITDTTYADGGVCMIAPQWLADRNPSFDNLIVRKYAEPEPSVSLGGEESA